MATLQFTPITVTGTTASTVTMNFLSDARTSVAGVSAAGVVYGSYSDTAGSHGFIDNGGTITTIDAPGGTNTLVTAVDAAGNIYGTTRDSHGMQQGFVDSAGTFITISIPGANFGTAVSGVDAAGDIFGYYNTDIGTPGGYIGTFGFVDKGGVITTVSVPGAVMTQITAVNAAGDIVGSFNDNNTEHGFIDSGGTIATIDPPGSLSTQVTGIDTAGDIVGYYYDGNGEHGFIESGGTFTTIDGPVGSRQLQVNGISAAGEAYGSYYDGNGQQHGFVYSNGTLMTVANSTSVTGTDAAGDPVGNNGNQGFIDSGATSTPVQAQGTFGARISAISGAYIAGTYTDSSGQHGVIYDGQTVTTIDLGSFVYNLTVAGINGVGDAYGAYTDRNGNFATFVDIGGTATLINVPGASQTQVTGIDAAGDIAGTYYDSGNVAHGFVDKGGTFTTIDAPGATSTIVVGVDAAGDIFGNFFDSVNLEHGFVDKAGTFTTVNELSMTNTGFTGVNAAGDAFGSYSLTVITGIAFYFRSDPFNTGSNTVEIPWYSTGSANGAFFYNNGLTTLFADASVAGVDSAGDVVGNTNGGSFVDAGGVITQFQIAGAQSFGVSGAADAAREAFGFYSDSNGVQHSFVMNLSPATAPTISGTVHGQTTTANAAIHPFSGVTVGDGNLGGSETLTITLSGPGRLSGAGSPTNGTYTLAGAAADVTAALHAVTFTATGGIPNMSVTTTFALSDQSSLYGTPVADTSTSVVASWVGSALPAATVHDFTATSHHQAIALTSLLSISDPNGLGYQKLELWESLGSVAGDQFVVNGVTQGFGQKIDVAAADVANTTFDVGAMGGTDKLWAQVVENDGTLSGWQQFNVTSPPDQTPVASVANFQYAAGHNEIIAATSLFALSDGDHDAITAYQFWDSAGNPDGGHWVVGGVAQPVAQAIDVTPAQLSSVEFQSGSGSNHLWVRASDGAMWGAWQDLYVNAPIDNAPVVSGSDISLTLNTSAAASSLFDATDADSDPIKTYELWDSVNPASNGHFVLGGAIQSSGQGIFVDAANIGQASFVASSSAATDRVWERASDGNLWGDWHEINVTSRV